MNEAYEFHPKQDIYKNEHELTEEFCDGCDHINGCDPREGCQQLDDVQDCYAERVFVDMDNYNHVNKLLKEKQELLRITYAQLETAMRKLYPENPIEYIARMIDIRRNIEDELNRYNRNQK